MSYTLRDDRPMASELKFLVTPDVARRVREWARAEMAPDPYASGPDGDMYRITSEYFDTADLDVFFRRGSFGRSKYRVRRYGSSDMVFLERKMRTKTHLSKRRTLVPITDLDKLRLDTIDTGWAGAWFHRRILARELGLSCRISYQRTARVAMTPSGPVRLTVDEELHATSLGGVTNAPVAFSGSNQILELKYRDAMPALFKRLVETVGIRPARMSKYRLAVPALGLVPLAEEASCQTS